jgi:ABC-2 type transport system permease protein
VNRTRLVGLVAGREISERLRSRAIRITTVIMTILVVAAVVVPGLIHSSTTTTRLGLVGARAQALGPALAAAAQAAKLNVTVENVPTAEAARSEVERGRLDVALMVARLRATAIVAHTLSSVDRALLAVTIAAAHERAVLAAAGVPEATIRAARAGVPLSVVAVAPPPSQQTARSVAAVAAGLFLYVILAFYGGGVATGVAQEKTSRTAEVLISAVRPEQLLAGKVIGIGLSGLGQLSR